MLPSKRGYDRAFDIPVGYQGDNVAAEPQVCQSCLLFV